MKIFICFILLYQIAFSFKFPYELLKSPLIHQILKNEKIVNPDDPEMLGKLITNILMTILRKVTENKNNSIRHECIEFIKSLDDYKDYSDNYNAADIKNRQYKSRETTLKLILDSSKSRNELNYYKNCLNSHLTYLDYNQTINSYTYFIAIISSSYLQKSNEDLTNIQTFEDHSFLLGYCVPFSEKCNLDDYKEIVRVLNENYNYIFYPQDSTVETYIISDSKKDINHNDKLLISIIFLVIVGILIGLVLFQYPIYFLLKQCFKNENIINNEQKQENETTKGEEKLNEKEKKDNEKKYVPKWLLKLNSCFSLNENLEELFNLSTNTTNVNNYSGLMEIRGLNALSMNFTILGFTFIAIYNSPLKVIGIYQLFILLNHFLYFFIFIGLRFSPRIILSCSGYSLIYKYLCYIDKYNKNYSFFKFMLYQSHKFFIFIILFFFFIYSLNYLYQEINGILPIWYFFQKKIVEKVEFNNFWKLFFGIEFLFSENNNINTNNTITNITYTNNTYINITYTNNTYTNNTNKNYHLNDYFWIPFNELLFFVLSLCIITIGYKYNLRIDIFIIILILLIYVLKIIITFFIKDEYNSILYFYVFNYGEFMTSSIFNFPSFLIGLYFGLINYTLQKGLANKFDISISSKINQFSFLQKEETPEKKGLFDDDDEHKNETLGNTNNNDESKNYNSVDNNINNSKKNTINNNEGDNNNSNSKELKSFSTSEQNLSFLNSSIGFINFQKKYTHNTILSFIVFFSLFIPYIIHAIVMKIYEGKANEAKSKVDNEEDNMDKISQVKAHYNITNEYLTNLYLTDYVNNIFLKIFYTIDIEIIIFLIHWLFFILHINGNNNILSFFTNIIWGIFNKSYFSFIIVSNMVILFSIYSGESSISINIYTIYLYFIFISIKILVLMSLCYIFLELPLKKLIRLIFNRDEDNNENEENNSDEEEEDEDNEEKKKYKNI
jgi:hypothetical protein